MREENAKKFHLLADTLQNNSSTRDYYYHLNRVWSFLAKEFKKNMVYPSKCLQEDSNLILVWSDVNYYSELEITETGFVSSLYNSRDERVLLETNLGDYTLPTLDWIHHMKNK